MAIKIYNGGFFSLLRKFEKKQRPMAAPLTYLPPLDCDLDDLRNRTVTPETCRPAQLADDALERAYRDIQAEFLGQSALLYLHAMLIAISRRRPHPPETDVFFLRLWAEQGDWLGQNLSTRWKISAATSFAEIGATPDQRALGMGLSVLFDMMKLYETERSLNGRSGDKLGRRLPQAERPALPLEMRPYVVAKGDLDRNMLARLFQLSEQDPVIAPLARSMLMQVMGDPHTVFARMQRRKGIEPVEDDFI